MPEYRTQLAFKSKIERIAKVNTEIPHGSRSHAILPDTVKIPFNIDIESKHVISLKM